MKKTFFVVSVLALGAGMLFATASSALAYRGDPAVMGPNCTSERHEAVISAIKNKDYTTWKNLMEGRGVAQRVTEQNFSRFADMLQLRLQGKTDEANKIRAELGLGVRSGFGFGRGSMAGEK